MKKTVCWGGFLAGIIFISIYGIYVLNGTYVDWILNAGGDFTQSYYGWRFFRASAWHWPIALMDHIAYPELTSIIYVDSIPIMNVIFKAIRLILPETFQFFGIWGLMCFVLSGMLGSAIVYRMTSDKIYSIAASLFFSLSSIMIHRLFKHTALAANWIILLCIFWILNDWKTPSLKRNLAVWAGLFFLCVSVNIYYIPIIGILMVAYLLYVLVKYRNWRLPLGSLLTAGVSVIFTFYLYGGFYHLHTENVSPDGLGYYSANLNSLFNPMEIKNYLNGHSLFFKTLPMATNGQYEGYAYLGAGVMLLAVIGFFLFYRKSSKKNFKEKCRVYHYEVWFVSIAVVLLYLAALGPDVTLGSHTLFTIPYPDSVLKIYSIFRSTGRFLWGVWDILVILILYLFWKYRPANKAIYIVLFCIMLQILDLSFMIGGRFLRYARKQEPYVSSLFDSEWDSLLENKEEMVLFNKQMLRLQTYYDLGEKALNNQMGINDFYYSRRNAADIDAYKEKMHQEVVSGKASEKAVYMVDTFEDVRELLPYLNFYYVDGLLVGEEDAVVVKNHILDVNPICTESLMQENQKVISDLVAGAYVIEMHGNRSSEMTVSVAQKPQRVYDRYDGGGMGVCLFSVENGEDVLIETMDPGGEFDLYKIVIEK